MAKRNLKEANSASQDQRQRIAQAPKPVVEEANLKAYQSLVVLGNYPNPAQNQAIIHLGLLEKSNLQVEIYDLKGELKQAVVNGIQEIGMYQLQFNTQNLENGMYLIKVSNGKEVVTKKMLIQR